MDKYKKLISNTIIFAISTFSSKVLVFLLMPLYTKGAGHICIRRDGFADEYGQSVAAAGDAGRG